MKKYLTPFVMAAFLSCAAMNSIAQTTSATLSKVQNLATVTENVLAITGTSTGNESVDKFLTSTSNLLQSYQKVNSSINAFNLLKNGKVSDGTKNLTKMAALAKLGSLTGQLGSLTKEATSTAATGTNLVKTLTQQAVGKSEKATETVETINKVKTAVDALTLLGVELPTSVKTANEKITAIKSATGL